MRNLATLHRAATCKTRRVQGFTLTAEGLLVGDEERRWRVAAASPLTNPHIPTPNQPPSFNLTPHFSRPLEPHPLPPFLPPHPCPTHSCLCPVLHTAASLPTYPSLLPTPHTSSRGRGEAEQRVVLLGVLCWQGSLLAGFSTGGVLCWRGSLLAGFSAGGVLCWRLVLVLAFGAGAWRWCWCLVLAAGAGAWCWCLVLAAGASAWCWRLALVLVPGAGGWCWCLVLAAGAGAGACRPSPANTPPPPPPFGNGAGSDSGARTRRDDRMVAGCGFGRDTGDLRGRLVSWLAISRHALRVSLSLPHSDCRCTRE
ncbi:unnamed protein product [Closterium sp. NIES-64]|nr:unnamed protein product [Closterium sp. NIES-64]